MATNNEVSIEQVLEALEDHIKQHDSIEDAASSLGVTRGFLWKVRNRKQPPPNSILKLLGFTAERQITYVYSRINNDEKSSAIN